MAAAAECTHDNMAAAAECTHGLPDFPVLDMQDISFNLGYRLRPSVPHDDIQKSLCWEDHTCDGRVLVAKAREDLLVAFGIDVNDEQGRVQKLCQY